MSSFRFFKIWCEIPDLQAAETHAASSRNGSPASLSFIFHWSVPTLTSMHSGEERMNRARRVLPTQNTRKQSNKRSTRLGFMSSWICSHMDSQQEAQVAPREAESFISPLWAASSLLASYWPNINSLSVLKMMTFGHKRNSKYLIWSQELLPDSSLFLLCIAWSYAFLTSPLSWADSRLYKSL